jgi:hypothetical protein
MFEIEGLAIMGIWLKFRHGGGEEEEGNGDVIRINMTRSKIESLGL